MIPPPLRPALTPSRRPRPASPTAVTTPASVQSQRRKDTEEKTLYVGDSISSNVDFDALEKGIKSKIIAVKAYSSVYEDEENEAKIATRYPESNYTDVIAANLDSDNFDNLVVQAGTVDITS